MERLRGPSDVTATCLEAVLVFWPDSQRHVEHIHLSGGSTFWLRWCPPKAKQLPEWWSWAGSSFSSSTSHRSRHCGVMLHWTVIISFNRPGHNEPHHKMHSFHFHSWLMMCPKCYWRWINRCFIYWLRLFSNPPLVLYFQCQPGCLTIQIRTVLCIFLVLLTYSVTQACVVSVTLITII